MNSQYLITNIKRIAIACMAIALIITSSMLLMRKSPPQTNTATNNEKESAESGKTSDIPSRQVSDHDHLATINVIVLHNGKDLPLAITVGNKSIEIPGPSSWPKTGNDGATNSEKGRFLAGIIDTADVLKANGFNPDDPYKISVGGTPLNASNTFRVVGSQRSNLSSNQTQSFTEEYHTPPNEDGIWRSLKFKNIVLSYGQVPSLSDFLVSSQPTSKHMLDQTTNREASIVSNVQSTNPKMDDTLQAQAEHQKFREDLNNDDPKIRARGIERLLLSSDTMDTDQTTQDMVPDIEKALKDSDATVRESALRALNAWDGNIPMQPLADFVLNDQSPDLRIQAMSLLVDRYEQKSLPTLQQASHDPDSRVAERASQYLQAYSQ